MVILLGMMPKPCLTLLVSAAQAGLLPSLYVVQDEINLSDTKDSLLQFEFALRFKEHVVFPEEFIELVRVETVGLLEPPRKIASPDASFVESLFARCLAYRLSKEF